MARLDPRGVQEPLVYEGGQNYLASYFARLVVGFGLFKAVLDQAYSSALLTAHSAYPIVNSVEFSIAASFAILAACLVVMVVGWHRPSTTLRTSAMVCMVLLLGADCVSALGILGNLPGWSVSLGLPIIYGAAAVVTNAAWLLPIAYLPARWCLAALSCSYLLAKAASEVCSALGPALVPAALLSMGVVSIILFLTVRASGFDGTSAQKPSHPLGVARSVVVELAAPLAVFVVLSTILGLIMAFQATGEQPVEGSAFLKVLASGAAHLLLLGVAVFAKGMPNIRRVFGLLFPIGALLLMALPFMDHVYGALFGVLLMFLQGVVSTMVLFMLLLMARRLGVPVIAMVAAISFVSRTFVLVGLWVGGLLGSHSSVDHTVRALILVVVALYFLSLALWFVRGRVATAAGLRETVREYGTFDELDGLCVEDASAEDVGVEDQAIQSLEDTADPLDRRAQELAKAHRLTAREAEVGCLLARGRSASYIADELGISLHTVRGYIKDVYAKLGIHARQELIDLYTGPRP